MGCKRGGVGWLEAAQDFGGKRGRVEVVHEAAARQMGAGLSFPASDTSAPCSISSFADATRPCATANPSGVSPAQHKRPPIRNIVPAYSSCSGPKPPNKNHFPAHSSCTGPKPPMIINSSCISFLHRALPQQKATGPFPPTRCTPKKSNQMHIPCTFYPPSPPKKKLFPPTRYTPKKSNRCIFHAEILPQNTKPNPKLFPAHVIHPRDTCQKKFLCCGNDSCTYSKKYGAKQDRLLASVTFMCEKLHITQETWSKAQLEVHICVGYQQFLCVTQETCSKAGPQVHICIVRVQICI
jgi:hypothetical protein